MRTLLLFACLSYACGSQESLPALQLTNTKVSSDAELATIHYSGRFTADKRFAWSGSSVEAHFTGTSVSIVLSGGPASFVAEIDGQRGAPFTSTVEPQSHLLGAGLAPGEHTIKVIRRGEALWGVTQFGGFEIADGALVDSDPPPYSHRLLVLGDSITCGYGDLGVNGLCHFELATEDETVAYPMMLAGLLDADVQVISSREKGLYRFDTTVNQMPVLFERTLPFDESSVWDHAQYTPDIIVIDLGTNDSTLGDPGQPFEDTYVAFLGRLRGLFPAADIFVTVGPWHLASYMYTHLTNVVASVGDAHVRYIPLDDLDPADGYGCDAHPNALTHQRMARQLADEIRSP